MKRCFTIELLFSISMREGRVPSPGRTLMNAFRLARVRPSIGACGQGGSSPTRAQGNNNS